MRYMNWDVLVFPESGDSKAPLQEFSTACTVIQDPAFNNITMPLPSHPTYFKPVTHPLPTVICFVPSLLPESPFKVSLHSWATPVASRATQAMAAQGNSVWFEAKVFLDGVCSAGILFSQDTSWPQVIAVDKENKQEQLRFPPFPAELLTQIWANPAQGTGTVRVVIAEGINQGAADNIAFVRLRNIVTFSFQHAPLHTLENSGLAWPNPGMWWQGQQQFNNLTSPHAEPADAESHVHSPRRRRTSKESTQVQAEQILAPSYMSQGLMAHPAFRARAGRDGDPSWSPHGTVPDPFTGSAITNSFYKRVSTRNPSASADVQLPNQSRSTSTSHDESMPDYSRPHSPQSSCPSYPMPDYSSVHSEGGSRRSYPISDCSRPATLSGSRQASEYSTAPMSELGLGHVGIMLQSNQEPDGESRFNDMMAAFSPRKSSNSSGISAPSNTRVSSAANSPPGQSRVISAAARDRVASYAGLPRTVPVTMRDPPRPGSHISSSNKALPLGYSPSLATVPGGNVVDTNSQSAGTIRKRPVGRPKGRKEGKSSEPGGLDVPVNKTQRRTTTGSIDSQGKENDSASPEKLGDGKRKRAANITASKVTLEKRLEHQDTCSPTRKVSKIGPQSSPSADLVDLDDLTAEGVVARVPLNEVENRI